MYAQYLTAPPSILRCLANGQGGITQGPLMSARGAVGSQDLSPAAADWVTSGVVPSQHTSGRGSALCVMFGLGSRCQFKHGRRGSATQLWLWARRSVLGI